MKFLVLLILVGFSGVILNDYNEYPFAFGSHENEHVVSLDDPVISIQDNKANIIWRVRNQNADSEITFTQIVDGKTTIQPKTILKEPRIGFTKIISHDDDIFVVYEQYTPNNQSPPSFFTLASHDDGKTFSEPKLLLTGDDVYYDINIVDMVNQKMYVFGTMWTRAENTSYVFYSASDDFGKTFSEPTKIFNQGKVRQDIVYTVSDGTIYLLADDEKDFDEKGHLYLFKILPDGIVTEKVSVNNAETSVTNQKIAVSGDDVYVSWLDRPNDTRWFSSFAASHDGGATFSKSKYLPSDPDSIDTYHPDGLGIFVINETVNVLWESDYWDGQNQTIKTFVGTSNNRGKDFQMEELPTNSFLSQYSRVMTLVDGNKQYYIAPGLKNYPYENSAIYFNAKDEKGNYSEIVDILQDYQTSPGGVIADVDDGFVHIVMDAYDSNCILYMYSSDDGKNFRDPLDLAKLETQQKCLGKTPKVRPPLQQLKEGTLKHNIECRTIITDMHVLMLKESDGKPVCISSGHIMPMIERGYIDEDSFAKFAVMASEQFVDSAVYDVQNLSLHYNGQLESLPPHVSIAGTFESSKQLYPNAKSDGDIYRYTISLLVKNVNEIHKAVINDAWDLLGQKPAASDNTTEIHSAKYSTILTIEDPVNNSKLLPVAVTDIDTDVNGQAVWDRFSINTGDGDTRGKSWDFLPRGQGQWRFVDEKGNGVWDDSVIDHNHFAIADVGIAYVAICDDRRVEITNGISPTIPILPDVDTVFMTEKNIGILPDSQGRYNVEFLSIYPTLVNLPQNATDSSIKSSICVLVQPKDKADFAYFTEVDFGLSS